jgi:hypothetical protein
MSLLRPMASLTGALLVRRGNAVMAGWTMPPAHPLAAPDERQPRSEGLRLVEKGQGRPSGVASDDENPSGVSSDDEKMPVGGATMRVSFRVDAERHHRLRQAALHQGRSQQQLLVAALDAYLERDAALVDAGNA